MAITLSEPAYTITCPSCLKDNLFSIGEMLSLTWVHCTCYQAIKVADHYRRNEIAELVKLTGRYGFFTGGSDSKWFSEHPEEE
jgi:hypothetical protein